MHVYFVKDTHPGLSSKQYLNLPERSVDFRIFQQGVVVLQDIYLSSIHFTLRDISVDERSCAVIN